MASDLESIAGPLLRSLPLNEEFYSPLQEESDFLKSQTGITDDEALKKHVIAVQTKAYNIFPYPCIRAFRFLNLKISRLPAYPQLLKLAKEREGATLLDIGCCFGNDIRKAVADGFPIQGVIGSDLHAEFWEFGHELYKTTPETYPALFIAGDAFNPLILEIVPPFYSPPETSMPSLASLTSLNPLHGHLSAIHTSSFFHLFDEEQQLHVAHALASLLSPLPGSIIFGAHSGNYVKGLRVEGPNSGGLYLFCHSPESWKDLWDGEVFKKGTVRVEASLTETEVKDLPPDWSRKQITLVWSVTRL